MDKSRRTFIKGMAATAAVMPFSGVLASEFIRKSGEDKYPSQMKYEMDVLFW